MTTPGAAIERSTDSTVDVASVAASLQALDARIASMAEVIDALRPLVPLAEQAPAVAAMIGDSFDDMVRSAIDRGVDVERGLLNGAEAALRFGATMDAGKVRELEALLQSGVLDPAALRIIGELGRAMIDTASAQPRAVGLMGLFRALGDPNVQRALGFLITFADQFGRRLREPHALRP